MIKELHLRNFQGHTNTHLVLSPGVNVITGPSNVGKSSIIRALFWLCRNRPAGAGDNYKHHDAGKEPISITATLDNAIITRFKKSTTNGYQIKPPKGGTYDELVAIRNDVPTEVSSLLDMADHNLQLQHQSYFLVADSAGDVGRKLNEVAGLDLIDGCLKNANLLVTRNQQDTNVCTARIVELEEQIEQFSDINYRHKALLALEILQSQIQVCDNSINYLETTLTKAQTITNELQVIDEFLEIEIAAAPLFELQIEIDVLDNKIKHLQNTINQGTRLHMECETLDVKIKTMEAELHKRQKEQNVCPQCGQEIK